MPLDNIAFTSPDAVLEEVAGLNFCTRLYMGRKVPLQHVDALRGPTVGAFEVSAFIHEVVGKEFPDGFTVVEGEGGWMDRRTGGAVREPSVILEVMHGAQGFGSVRRVAEAWKARFYQDAVMVATVPVAVSFV